MSDLFLFWDKRNDTPELLGEDGEFYSYGEDSIAIARNEEGGYYWTQLEKLKDVTPLNTPERFEVFNPESNLWESILSADEDLIKKIQKHVGVKYWEEVY